MAGCKTTDLRSTLSDVGENQHLISQIETLETESYRIDLMSLPVGQLVFVDLLFVLLSVEKAFTHEKT